VVLLVLLGVVLDTAVVFSLVVVVLDTSVVLVWVVDLHRMNHQVGRHQAAVVLVVLLALLKLVYIECIKFYCFF
jgi:hypothetical protein